MIRSNDHHHHHNESGKHHHHPSKSTKAERRKQNAAAQQEQLNYNSQADSRANGAGNNVGSANFTQDFNFKKKIKHRNQDDQFDP